MLAAAISTRRPGGRYDGRLLFCPRCRAQYTAARRYCPEDGERLRSSISESSFRAKQTGRIGAIFGSRYQIRGIVGKGATARIYLADDLFMKRPVALKLFTPSGNPALRQGFEREAKVAMSVAHPNVVKIYDAGVRPDRTPYIVMEPLVGETLGELLRRDGVLGTEIALTVFRQAAAGLSAVHRAGVVHRDVKPDNIFLVGEIGQPYGVKIVDFGFAKAGRRPGGSAAGVILGTIEYMAPEQVVSDPSDPRTDVYALGVVMFRALTGKLPFDVQEDMELLAHQLLSPTPKPSQYAAGIDPRFEAVILSATRKSPENRYPSMDLLGEDVERIVGTRPGEPVGAPLVVDPDRYEVQTTLGRNAARVFYDTLGVPGAPSRR